MTDPYSTNITAMHLAADELAKRYNAIVIDPETRVKLAKVCADFPYIAKVIKRYGDYRGQVVVDVCADVLGSGFDPWNIVEALPRSTGGQPVSHVVDIAAGAFCVFVAICLYTDTSPGSLATSFGRWITCGPLGRLVRQRNMS